MVLVVRVAGNGSSVGRVEVGTAVSEAICHHAGVPMHWCRCNTLCALLTAAGAAVVVFPIAGVVVALGRLRAALVVVAAVLLSVCSPWPWEGAESSADCMLAPPVLAAFTCIAWQPAHGKPARWP